MDVWVAPPSWLSRRATSTAASVPLLPMFPPAVTCFPQPCSVQHFFILPLFKGHLLKT